MRCLFTAVLMLVSQVCHAMPPLLLTPGGFGVYESSGTAESPIFHWDASGTGSGTIIIKQTATTITQTGTVSYLSDGTSGKGAEFIVDGANVRFTGGVNFPYSSGRVEFWYKNTLAGDLSAATMWHAGNAVYKISRRLLTTSTLRVGACASTWDIDVGVNIFDGSWHKIVFSWDDPTNTMKIQIDGGTVFTESTSMTGACSSATSTYIGGAYTGTPVSGGVIDELKYYNTTL